MSKITRVAKKILPRRLISAIYRKRFRSSIKLNNKGLTTQEVFTRIYKERVWGQSADPSDEYYSGTGSRDSNIVDGYVDSVSQFLRSFDSKPTVVDLGCGDFVVGSQIRPLCGRYVACDIVAPLIEFNKEKYRNLNVDFKVLDLTTDNLPEGDILFIRQVLQHLSNKQIRSAIRKISGGFKYLVLTEHLPTPESFSPNLDIPTGAFFRLSIGSGVILTKPPFNLRVKDQQTLCVREESGGIIKTILYTL
jgi:SAM-dependent methyltransferase